MKMSQTPVRVSKTSSQTGGADTPKMSLPKPPKRPKLSMPYSKYTKRKFDEVKAKYPDKKIWELSRIIGQMWRELDESEKNIYNMEYEKEKVIYEREKIEYEREKIEYEKAKEAYERSLSKNDNSDTPKAAPATGLDGDKADGNLRNVSSKKSSKSIDQFLPSNVPSKFSDRLVLEIENQKPSNKYESYHEEIILAHERFNNNNQYMEILFNSLLVGVPQRDANRLNYYASCKKSLIDYKGILENEIEEELNKFNQLKREREENNDKFLDEIKKIKIEFEKQEKFEKMASKATEEKKDVGKKDSDSFQTKTPNSKAVSNLMPSQITKDESQDNKVYNKENLDTHNDDSGSTEIDDEEMDSN